MGDRQYVIVDADNDLDIKRDKWFRPVPRIVKNVVTLFSNGKECTYVSDPSKTYRVPWSKWFGIRRGYTYTHFWREGIANPIDLNARGDKDIAGDVLSIASTARKTEMVLERETDWKVILLIFLVIAVVGEAIAIASMSGAFK